MSKFTNKIDFEVLVMVKNANPNGDPLNGNRPRETYDGYGEISDVCIKRKIRNRLQDMGERVFVQSDERSDDGCKSLADRAKSNAEMQKALKDKDKEAYAKAACETWIDVRSFGQVFAFSRLELRAPHRRHRWIRAHSPPLRTHAATGSMIPPQSAARSPGSRSRCRLVRQLGQWFR